MTGVTCLRSLEQQQQPWAFTLNKKSWPIYSSVYIIEFYLLYLFHYVVGSKYMNSDYRAYAPDGPVYGIIDIP